SLYAPRPSRPLPSFPTRRSSDLKAETWRRLTAEALPNWLQRALLVGFYHPSQLALTGPYVPAYFDAIGRVWATHDNQNAQEFVRSEEHTSELQSRGHLVCRLLLE